MDPRASDTLSGVGTGASTGAAIGSFAGPWGTAIGAGVGAIGGGIAGFLSGSGKKKAQRRREKAQRELEAKMASAAAQLKERQGYDYATRIKALNQAAATFEPANNMVGRMYGDQAKTNLKFEGDSRLMPHAPASGAVNEAEALKNFISWKQGQLPPDQLANDAEYQAALTRQQILASPPPPAAGQNPRNATPAEVAEYLRTGKKANNTFASSYPAPRTGRGY